MYRRTFVKLMALPALTAFGATCACACTPQPPSGGEGASIEGNSTNTPAPAAQLITDAYGRTVSVPGTVSRVATVGSGARIVAYAGAAHKLVAVTDMDRNASPTRPYTVAHAATFAALPSTSNGNHLNETEVDAEALLALAPDLIVSSRSAAECDALQTLLNIPVIGVSYQDDLFGASIKTSITSVAHACNTQATGDALIAALGTWEADIRTRLAQITMPAPTAYVAGLNFKGSKGFTGTTAAYPVFDILGVPNVAAASGNTANFDTTIEQIGAWDPAYIFVNMSNAAKLQADYDAHAAFFDTLRAFTDGNIYTQPSFTYNGTNTELAICDLYWTSAVLFPDAFGDCASPDFFGEIMETFLHVDVYGELSAAGVTFERVEVW